MRDRSKSAQLDVLMALVEKTVLDHQNPVTGLFENNKDDFPGHALVRDNLYAAQALWAMYRAYRKSAVLDENLAKADELRCTCIKIMQSLLECMMRQADKVEVFKKHLRACDSLHAKFSVQTKLPVVGDNDWGHLQIDAIALYLITLAQMTASGLPIVRNFDEVAFIQNLVYYIEVGYRTPDYGIWERGDKTNQGICELNASSIGMAKAALQAMNDVGDLFSDGSKGSIIHVLPDEIQQCSAVLSSMLPRESFSKETDAALLAVIGYPAFAVEDPSLVQQTRDTVIDSLLGRYGCRRFLRDGYKTALEDPNRLYYINAELQKFENIECEWPVFLVYLCLDAMFYGEKDACDEFWNQLQEVIIHHDLGKSDIVDLIPELYLVPGHLVELERQNHGSQDRIPSGSTPFLWAQSLYIVCCLLRLDYLTPSEIDPLSRRLAVHERRSPCEVQVVILAESPDVQSELLQHDIKVQLLSEVDPVFCIQPASVFAQILSKLGSSDKLNLTGRPLDREIGLLSTSKLYHLGQKFVVFTPQFMDRRRSHLMYDIRILMDEWTSELHYIYNAWNSSGRPLVVLVVSMNMLSTDSGQQLSLNRRQKGTVLGTIKKIKNGYIGGARVVMKNISDFFRTTSVSKLEIHDGHVEDIMMYGESSFARSLLQEVPMTPDPGTSRGLKRTDSNKGDRWTRQFSAVHRASIRHRSIALDSNDSDLAQLRLQYKNQRPPDLTPVNEGKISETPTKDPMNELKFAEHLHTSNSNASMSSGDSSNMSRLDINQMEGMSVSDLVDMLYETTILDEQASVVHYLWMKQGPQFDTRLNNVSNVTVRVLMQEIYLKSCESRDWSWVRLSAGLLDKQLDELSKAVTHLLVRQKQLTVGMPSKSEEPITCPKTKEELVDIFKRAYPSDPNANILAQEIIVCLGSLVRTDPRLFVEMFRLRIGLIIQVLASELARIRKLSAEEAAQRLLAVSPFEVKCMLFSLLSGRLIEDLSTTEDAAGKELHTGMGSFRKQIEERKSLRKSVADGSLQDLEDTSDSDEALAEDFQFGLWLRHRRIDGALNRVPPEFYSNLWDTVRKFPHGLAINRTILQRHLTQEMTRREIKFALEVEHVLNQISEPEYREMIVEALTLMGHLEHLLMAEPQIPQDQPFEVDIVVQRANRLFVEHNRRMGTIVLECCGSENPCDGAHNICQHFYDTAPAGEFGTAHYIIKALMDIFIAR